MFCVVLIAFCLCFLMTIWMGYTLTMFHDNEFINLSGFGLDISHVFNIHPTFMVFGLVGCNFVAITVFYYLSDSSYSQMARKKLHMTLQTIALVVAWLGVVAVFRSHNAHKPRIQNMYSMHSWIGLFTMLIFTAQYILGFTVYFYPRAKEQIRRQLMPRHRFIGIILVVSIVASIISGIQEKLGFNGTCNVVVASNTNDHTRLLDSHRQLHLGHKTGYKTFDCMYGTFIGIMVFFFAVFVLAKVLPTNRKDQLHDVVDSKLELEEFEGLTMSIE